MRNKLLILPILLLVSCFFIMDLQVAAQTNPQIVNLSLTFHPYAIILNDPNGSFCVYDGADGLAASSSIPTQVNLVSQISGQQTVYGISVNYWSAVMIWAVKLPKDLHVDGTVNIKAYISSDFPISGLMSGSGYGMGLVDIDENNNEVQEFVTQAPYSIGSNAFSPTPQQYSVSTDVDYVFKAGHSIGFAVGIGATAQGFTASVYFGSEDKPSGATLPVVDTIDNYSFTVDSQTVSILSDSVISDFQYDSTGKYLQFKSQLISYTTGYCNLTIPKTLIQSPFTVTSGSQGLTSTLIETQNSYILSFTHVRDIDPIVVTGESANPTSTPVQTPDITEPTNQSPIPTNGPTPEIAELSFIALLAIVFGTTIAVIYKKRS